MKQLNDTLKIKDKRSFILPPKGSNFSDWRSIKTLYKEANSMNSMFFDNMVYGNN